MMAFSMDFDLDADLHIEIRQVNAHVDSFGSGSECIDTALEAELDKGAYVLAKAFEKQPFTQAATGHAGFDTIRAYERALLGAAALGGVVYFAYAKIGRGYEAIEDEAGGCNHADGSGDNVNSDEIDMGAARDLEVVIGVAAWFQPGHAMLLEKEHGSGEWGMYGFMAGLPEELRTWWAEYTPRYNAQCDRACGLGVKLDSWHLQLIGVLPSARHRGVGRMLVHVGEERARKDKKPIVVVAADLENVEKFYGALGFNIKPSGPPEHPGYEEYADYRGERGAIRLWVMMKEI